ncbi:MAG: hypothetical protein AAGD14_11155 [Planctomycetota bacterium]
MIRMPGLLLRADMRSDGDPLVSRWRQDWPDAASAVAHALDEVGRASRRVWVLDSDVWLGVVDLPDSAVAGLSDKDLVEPAAFEAEPISDIRPSDAVTAVQRRRMSGEGDQFLVVQARRADVTAVAKAVRRAGSKLAGMGHPAGLGESLVSDGPSVGTGGSGDWRRLEFWPDSVVLTESSAGRTDLIPLGIGPGSSWRRALEPLLRQREPAAEPHTLVAPGVQVRGGLIWRENVAASGTAHWLVAGEDQSDDDDGVPVIDLSEDVSADVLAATWARTLATVDPAAGGVAPMLRQPKAPAARWPAVVVGVLAFAVALGLVLYQRDQAAKRLEELQGRLEHAETEARNLGNRRKQAQQAKVEVRRKEKAVENLEREVQNLRKQRTITRPVQLDRRAALAAMMSSLTSLGSKQVVIQSIEHGSPRHTIKGTALSPDAASRLARELSRTLRRHWAVSPAQIDPKSGPQRMVWTFSIEIEPVAGVQR